MKPPYRLPMPLLLVLVLALATSAPGRAQGLPPDPPMVHVFDDESVLPASDLQALDARLAALDDSTSVQVAILTTRLHGVPAADLARWTLNSMRLGKPGVNNGVLVLLAPGDREVHVSVGTGLEWQIPDSAAAAAVAQMLPLFRDGDYAGGLRSGVEALAERAGSVPWAVRYTSASEAVGAGTGALGEITRLRGAYAHTHNALQTEAGPVLLSFPPYWEDIYGSVPEGDDLDLLGRVVEIAPLVVEVLGLTPASRRP